MVKECLTLFFCVKHEIIYSITKVKTGVDGLKIRREWKEVQTFSQ